MKKGKDNIMRILNSLREATRLHRLGITKQEYIDKQLLLPLEEFNARCD